MSDLVVEIPAGSRLETAVLSRETMSGTATGQTLATGWRFAPPLEKRFLELTPPTLEDNASDLSRLLRCADKQCGKTNIEVDFSVVQKIAAVVRKGNWNVTATFLDRRRAHEAHQRRAGRYPEDKLLIVFRHRHHGCARATPRPRQRKSNGTMLSITTARSATAQTSFRASTSAASPAGWKNCKRPWWKPSISSPRK